MHILLLTHSRELNKQTNTGSLVAQVLGDRCQLITWNRVEPDQALLHRIENESMALLYPSEDAELLMDGIDFNACIIIDGTWQEAQKIYNRSPYLKKLKKIKINSPQQSVYSLRRNQKKGGLCTAECAAQVLKSAGYLQQAQQIEKKLVSFISHRL